MGDVAAGSERHFEEREDLRAAVRRALHDGIASTRRCWDDPAAWVHSWQRAVRLELPGLVAPEEVGGSGAGVSVLVAALEASGRTLAPVPLRSTAAASVPLLARASGRASEDALARMIAAGSACASAVAGTCEGSTVVLPAVAEAPQCEMLVVRCGDGVAVVDCRECVVVSSPMSIDPSVPVARVEIPATLLGGTLPVSDFEWPSAIARVGAAAELVGIASLGLDSAVEHSIGRVQFDKPIAAFQSVKHRLADVFVSLNRARGLVETAGQLLDADDRSGIGVSHFAYAAAAEAAVDAARTNVRLHGAMGATWALDAHLVLRRARHITRLFGVPGDHYRFGAAKLEQPFA